MLKGVNKHIIEIIPSHDEYFERAVLYLKPESEPVPRRTLMHAAGWYLKAAEPRRSRRLPVVLAAAGAFCLGAGIAVCCLLFF